MTKDEALKLALEALEESKTNNDTMEFHDRKNKAITAIKEALAQPAQEPDELTIAYMSGLYDGKKKRPWVGLTDEEVAIASAEFDTKLKLAFHAGMYKAQIILRKKNDPTY